MWRLALRFKALATETIEAIKRCELQMSKKGFQSFEGVLRTRARSNRPMRAFAPRARLARSKFPLVLLGGVLLPLDNPEPVSNDLLSAHEVGRHGRALSSARDAVT